MHYSNSVCVWVYVSLCVWWGGGNRVMVAPSEWSVGVYVSESECVCR